MPSFLNKSSGWVKHFGCGSLHEPPPCCEKHNHILSRRHVQRPAVGIEPDVRLLLEALEPRQLLSASGFKPDYYLIPHAGSSISGYTPAQIRAAYGFNNVSFGSTAADGRGQTIAIIDAYNDPNITSDLAAFDSKFGIAAPASFKIVNQNGGTSLPGTDPSQGWEGETALDVEWAHAIAPGANILLVEANNASDSNLFAAVNYARQQSRCFGHFDELGKRRQRQQRLQR